jgi:hypothetical protein
MGPVIAQTSNRMTEPTTAHRQPAAPATRSAARSKRSEDGDRNSTPAIVRIAVPRKRFSTASVPFTGGTVTGAVARDQSGVRPMRAQRRVATLASATWRIRTRRSYWKISRDGVAKRVDCRWSVANRLADQGRPAAQFGQASQFGESSRCVDQSLVLVLELPRLDEKRHVFGRPRFNQEDVALDLSPGGNDPVGLFLVQQCGALACVPRAPG